MGNPRTFVGMKGLQWICTALLGLLVHITNAQYDPHCSGKTAIVHLFEWTWTSIASECERFLGPVGYCGVQVSPPNEHVVLAENQFPWWQRYQPVSYNLDSRSGSRAQFKDMVERCNRVGVRVYVDAVVNHMAGMDRQGTGSGGSSFNTMDGNHDFPAVPYSDKDFTPAELCSSGCGCVDNYADPNIVRDCYLVGLSDLYGATDYVRDRVAEYFNDLIDLGVAGFRVDAAKHMWPEDIAGIQARLNSLPTRHGFKEDSRAFFYHEVIDRNDGAVLVDEYFDLGWVTEFRYSQKIGWAANGDWGQFGGLYDPGWGMGPTDRAFVFADNHDNQRGHGGGGDVVTHKTPAEYTAAISFMLAFDYGFTRVMSSYYFGEDTDQGPPNLGDENFTTAEVEIKEDGSCGGGWVCEHRWNAISKMVSFRTAVAGTPSDGFWSEGDSVGIARVGKGYFAMSKASLTKSVQTQMPGGQYINIINGSTVDVAQDGSATISINNPEGIFAICVGCDGTGPPTPPTPRPTDHPTESDTTTQVSSTTRSTEGPNPGTTPTITQPPLTSSSTSDPGQGTTQEGSCCNTLVLSSTGGISDYYPELLGKYEAIGSVENSRGVWRLSTILNNFHLHYTVDTHFKWEGWMVTEENNQTFGYISNEAEVNCPDGLSQGWDFQLPSGWQDDTTLAVSCL